LKKAGIFLKNLRETAIFIRVAYCVMRIACLGIVNAKDR